MPEHSFRIRKAAELSGVTEDLIRAWERRYGILKPRRTPGGYRVYSDADIAVLKRLKRLTEEGMSIAEAARLVPTLRQEVETGMLGPNGSASAAPIQAWHEQIMEAARSLDQRRVDAMLDQAFASLPTLAVVDQLLMPILRDVGDAWEHGSLTVAGEHLASTTIRARLISLLHGAPHGARKHVICACFPEEQHEIGLLAAALRFRHAGWRVTFLGQRTPLVDLVDAVRRLAPDLVAVSCSMDPGAAQVEEVLRSLLSVAPRGTEVVLGGAVARAHETLCRTLNVRPFLGDTEWDRTLS